MRLKRMLWLASVASVIAVGGSWIAVQFPERLEQIGKALGPKLDVHYVPTPEPVVDKMLELAKVGKDDVVYDLGCGDGRIVVTAAKQFGARGVGVDLDWRRIRESNANARKAGVTDRVTFVRGDLFKMDFKDATVVTLYLLPELNVKLRPKLFRELRPGTRIVSHEFDMGEWKPEKTVTVTIDQRNYRVHYWTIPAKEDQPTFKEEKSAAPPSR
jgi:SAM-dependent methyltransferase